MPPIANHAKASIERTGKEYREVHEWLDLDPEKKAERHDVTKMFEFGMMFEEKYGKEARNEYVRHLHDDIKTKFAHLQQDLERQIKDTLVYFGVK